MKLCANDDPLALRFLTQHEIGVDLFNMNLLAIKSDQALILHEKCALLIQVVDIRVLANPGGALFEISQR